MQVVLGTLGGAVGARLAINALNKLAPNLHSGIKAGVPAVGGGVLLYATKGNPFITGVGYGLIGGSVPSLAEAFVPKIGSFLGKTNIPADAESQLEIFNIRSLDPGVSAPADQSILSGPANSSILAYAPSEYRYSNNSF